MSRKILAYYTNFPDIFLKSYWGNNSASPEETIFENRNNLVDKYSIIKYHDRPSQKIIKASSIFIGNRDIRDHIEYYKCNDNKIITIFSNYNNFSEDELNLILSKGYSLTENLYYSDIQTYIKIFN